MARGARELSGAPAKETPRERRHRRLWILAKVVFGLAVVVFLLGSGRIEFSMFREFFRERPLDFALAQLVWYAGFHLTVVRWRILLSALDVPTRYSDAARLCWIGLLFSQVIPGATGGDVVKGIQVARESPGRRAEAVLSVVLDRAIGLTALMVIGVAGVLLVPAEVRAKPVLQQLGFILVGMIALIGLGGALLCWRGFWRHPRMARLIGRLPGKRAIGKLAEALWAMSGRRRALAMATLISLLAHVLFIVTALLLARGLTGEAPSLVRYLFLVPLGQLAFSLPITPGGLGVGQLAYLTLFELIGEQHGGELGVLIQLTTVLWSVVGISALFRGGKGLSEAWASATDENGGSAADAGGGAVPLDRGAYAESAVPRGARRAGGEAVKG